MDDERCWLTINRTTHAIEAADDARVLTYCGGEWILDVVPAPERWLIAKDAPDRCPNCLERYFDRFVVDEPLGDALGRGFRPV